MYEFTTVGFVDALRFWAPEVGPNITYRIIAVDVTNADDLQVKATAITNPLDDEWTLLFVDPYIFTPGSKLLVVIEALNSSSNSTFTHPWERTADQNTTDPSSGDWNRRKQNNKVRFHQVDDDAIDQSTDLDTVIAGTTIKMTNPSDASQFFEYFVTSVLSGPSPTVYEFETYLIDSGGGGPEVATVCDCLFTVPVPASTKYVEEAAGWTGNQPDYATVSGFLSLSGTEQSVATNQYGIDLWVQELTPSLDWELAAISSTAPSSAEAARVSGGVRGSNPAKPDTDIVTTTTVTTLKANPFLIHVLNVSGTALQRHRDLPITPLIGSIVRYKNINNLQIILDATGGFQVEGGAAFTVKKDESGSLHFVSNALGWRKF